MRFSIIINTHNQSAFIGDCIKSCINQKYSNFEIIITDTSNQKKLQKGKELASKSLQIAKDIDDIELQIIFLYYGSDFLVY